MIMKTEKNIKVVVVYKEGGNWIVNDDSNLRTLNHSIKTKKQVTDFLKEDYPDKDVMVIFAK
jgi:benzoyl-CoA reductase/2-hydroxyglutaryl-CoA dehydratase subunit BcrC/BadD/HgdB